MIPPEFSGDPDEKGDAFVADVNATTVTCGDIIISNPDIHDDDTFWTLETTVFPLSPEKAARFAASHIAEIDGLMEANVFSVMKRKDAISQGLRIFKSRFVDAVKKTETSRAIDKLRFIICGYNDKEAKELLTKAPTVSKNSTRVFLSLAASSPGRQLKLRDISQAFTRSRSMVQRLVGYEAPPELVLPKLSVLIVERPLYGLAEAAIHWYTTYCEYHVSDLSMTQTSLDNCLFFKPSSDPSARRPVGVVALQVDDSAICGTAEFLASEESHVKQFPCKAATALPDDGTHILFNGAEIRRQDEKYFLSCHDKCIDVLADIYTENFVSLRALAAYIALWSRPKLLGRIQLLASRVTSPQPEDIAELKDILHELRTDKADSKFQALDLDSVKLVCCTDAGFVSHNDYYRSRLGYVIAMVDASGAANVIAYASRKCRRVTQSVLASELLALVEGYDVASGISLELTEILQMGIPIRCIIDSRTLFNVVTRLGNVTEKRLMVDVADLRHENLCERLDLVWIPSGDQGADPFTKRKASYNALDALLTGQLVLNPNAWINNHKLVSPQHDNPVMPLS